MAFAFRSLARVLAAGLPRQDHVCKTTDESFCFHNQNFDEMRCKLDSTENPRSFEKYPTPPWGGVGYSSNHFCKTMSAGLAVFWQVSFLNRFCWIWSSGVVINTLEFSWMKRTCDVSKVFSQIESLQVDIKSLKYRKESFCSIIHYWYN